MTNGRRSIPLMVATIVAVVFGCSTAPSPAPTGAPVASAGAGSTPASTPVADVATSFPPLASPAIDVTTAPSRVHVASSGGVSAWIGPDGGTLTTTAGSGATLELDIPAGAVGEPTPISMTPIDQVDELGLRGGVSGAVYLSPPGLELAEPATLKIGDSGLPTRGLLLAGFDVEDDGTTALIPAAGDGQQITLTLFHFSSPGAGFGTSEDLLALAPATASGDISTVLTSLLAESTPWGPATMAQAFADISGVWLSQIRTELTTVADDHALLRALADWRQFVFLLNLYAHRGDVTAALADGSLNIVGPFPAFTDPSPFFTAGQTLVGSRIVDAANGNIARCKQNHDLNALANVMYWTSLGPRYSQSGFFDWTTLSGGCASVDVGTYNPAANLQAGGSDSFRIAFVLRFADGTQVPGDFQVAFDAGGFTFRQGGSSHLVAAQSAGSALTIAVDAPGDPPYDLSARACWFLGGLGRGLCGQFQREFGAQPTPTPTSPAPTSTAAAAGPFTLNVAMGGAIWKFGLIPCAGGTITANYTDGSKVTDATWTLTGPGVFEDPQPTWAMHLYATAVGTIVVTVTSGGHSATASIPVIKNPDPLPGPEPSC